MTGVDQPYDGEDDQEVVKLNQPSSGDDGEMIKVRIKILLLLLKFIVTGNGC